MTDAARDSRLFDAFRQILGRGLKQFEVDQINRALYTDLVLAPVEGFRLSQAGKDFIHGFESYSAKTYPDPGPTGKPITGGWGTTRDENGQPFRKLGVEYPKSYWEALYARDIAEFETGVNMLIKGGAPTTQPQFDALVSFAYNVGLDIDADDKAEGLGDSTLLKKHRAGDYNGAAAEFAKWNKSGGQVMKGLTRRRAGEAEIYLS